jgi:hypothetical protein
MGTYLVISRYDDGTKCFFLDVRFWDAGVWGGQPPQVLADPAISSFQRGVWGSGFFFFCWSQGQMAGAWLETDASKVLGVLN